MIKITKLRKLCRFILKNNYNTIQEDNADIVWNNNNNKPSYAIKIKNLVKYIT